MALHEQHIQTGYLEGQLLVATPSISGSCFDRSVIYIYAHNKEGAMGVIINHTIGDMRYAEVFDQLNITSVPAVRNSPVYFGGPVDSYRGFILFTNESPIINPKTSLTNQQISLSADINILNDIALGKGPRQSMLMLGYAGWAPDQLESEIKAGSWITVPANVDLVFNTDTSLKWHVAAQSLGIDMAKMSGDVGHA